MCVRVFALVILHANLIVSGSIIVSSVNCLSFPIFLHNLINEKIFGKKVMEHKMCVLIFCTHLSDTFPILKRVQRDRS